MIPAQFHIDIVGELERILPSHSYVVPSPVLRELEVIKKRSKGKDKIAAGVAIKIASSEPVQTVELELKRGEHVDNALLKMFKSNSKDVLCTNDRELRNRAKKRGITVVYLRQRRYLAVDGHLNI
ncbi:PIN like domain protein [anaerobic digester metagenome]